MRMQSTSAAAGSAIMATCFALPLNSLNSGTSQAPMISRNPGCTHSTFIVVFRTREPELPQDLRHHDDRDARDEAVERAPAREILEPEVRVVRPEETRHRDLAQRQRRKASVQEPCPPKRGARRWVHGNALRASVNTGSGYIPRSTLTTAVTTSGTTIHGTSTTLWSPASGGSSKYALYTMGTRYAALSSELISSTASGHTLPRSTDPTARYHLEMNPEAGGIPTRLRVASVNAAIVHGICFANPDN